MSVISLQMIPCLPMATMELESPRSPNFHQYLSRVETSSSLSNFPSERPSDIEKAFVCNWVFATQGGLMMRGVVQRCPQPPMRFVQLTTDKGPWHCFLSTAQEPGHFWLASPGCIWDTWVRGRGTCCTWFFSCSQIFSLQVGNPLLCELARQLISLGAYEPWIQVCDSCKTLSNLSTQQDLVAPAQYWHDPFNQTHFLVLDNRSS